MTKKKEINIIDVKSSGKCFLRISTHKFCSDGGGTKLDFVLAAGLNQCLRVSHVVLIL